MKTYGQINYEGAMSVEHRGCLWDSVAFRTQAEWEAGAAAVRAEYMERNECLATTVQVHANINIAALEAELAKAKGLLREMRKSAVSVVQRALAAMSAEERTAFYTPPRYDEQYHEAMEKFDAIERGEKLGAESVRIINSIVDANIPDENIEDKPPWVELESNVKPPPECDKCNKAGDRWPHTCPYQEDVNNNKDFLCNCCESCTTECARDI